MLKEVKRIQNEPLSDKELRDKISVFTTLYYRQNEQISRQKIAAHVCISERARVVAVIPAYPPHKGDINQ